MVHLHGCEIITTTLHDNCFRIGVAATNFHSMCFRIVQRNATKLVQLGLVNGAPSGGVGGQQSRFRQNFKVVTDHELDKLLRRYCQLVRIWSPFYVNVWCSAST